MKKLVSFVVGGFMMMSCSQSSDPVLGIYDCEITTVTSNNIEIEYFEMEVIKHWSNNQTEYQGVFETPYSGGPMTLNGVDVTPNYVTSYMNLESSDFEYGYLLKTNESNNTTIVITGYKK